MNYEMNNQNGYEVGHFSGGDELYSGKRRRKCPGGCGPFCRRECI